MVNCLPLRRMYGKKQHSSAGRFVNRPYDEKVYVAKTLWGPFTNGPRGESFNIRKRPGE